MTCESIGSIRSSSVRPFTSVYGCRSPSSKKHPSIHQPLLWRVRPRRRALTFGNRISSSFSSPLSRSQHSDSTMKRIEEKILVEDVPLVVATLNAGCGGMSAHVVVPVRQNQLASKATQCSKFEAIFGTTLLGSWERLFLPVYLS